jgi:hypothetical protein
MISLDVDNEEFQTVLRRELNLSTTASFHPRDSLLGTQLYEYCICTVRDGEITYILIRGSFVVTRVYVLVKTDFGKTSGFLSWQKNWKGSGLIPGKPALSALRSMFQRQ